MFEDAEEFTSMDEKFQWAHFLSSLQSAPSYNFSLTYKL